MEGYNVFKSLSFSLKSDVPVLGTLYFKQLLSWDSASWAGTLEFMSYLFSVWLIKLVCLWMCKCQVKYCALGHAKKCRIAHSGGAVRTVSAA